MLIQLGQKVQLGHAAGSGQSSSMKPRAAQRAATSARGKGIIYTFSGPSFLAELHTALTCLDRVGLPGDVGIRIRVECDGCASLSRDEVLGAPLSAALNGSIDVVPRDEMADVGARKWTLTKAVAAWSSPFEK